MSITVRTTPDAITYALASQYNALMKDVALAASKAHADVTSNGTTGDYRAPAATPLQVTAANGDGTLPTLITLCQNLYDVYKVMCADTLAHKAAWTFPAITRPLSSDTLATCETFLNALHTDYESHRADTTSHYTADSTNNDASASATDQATSDTRATNLKAKINAHIKHAPANALALNLVSP